MLKSQQPGSGRLGIAADTPIVTEFASEWKIKPVAARAIGRVTFPFAVGFKVGIQAHHFLNEQTVSIVAH